VRQVGRLPRIHKEEFKRF